MQPVAAFDPLDPEVVENPYPFYAALRAQAPVYPVPALGLTLVSSYAAVLEVICDAARFSSRTAPSLRPPPPEVRALLAQGWPAVDTLLTCDPPAHQRYRSRVVQGFSARRVAGLEDYIRKLATDLVEGFAREGEVELVRRFAVPLPLAVIADQLGVPRRDMPLFERWSEDSVAPFGGMISHEREVECARSVVAFRRYFAEKIAARRAGPRDDVLSDLVADPGEGVRPLDVAEVLSILQQILVAGNETTASLIASAMRLLLEHPDQLALVLEDPGLIPNMIEEALRLESPVQVLFRVATTDTQLARVPIPAGTRLAVAYGSANRDASQFPDPDRFDVRRPNARTHLAFGKGEHYCIGAALARKEAGVAFEVLLSRLRDLRLAPGRNDLRHVPSFVLRRLSALHVRFRPG